ncbi:MAG TPA: sulfatase-like hydrolase/transferase [Candidatus Latescibacteria bacterium]|jgi:arylsulfatase A-like enzyme|nr:sulfatase [Gemmatimonadaceae bacterium]HJP33597.1 sulfatase-like hydrolase/transferase [Candidatus Latescibacterota bacterium]
MNRPNILWISLEDTSPRFSCYGDEVARTPNIDRLAAAGCIYPRAFSVAGVCAPSRAAIITGMYPTAIGAHQMRTSTNVDPDRPSPYQACPPPYVKCFTEYLRGAGYYCTNNRKTDYQFEPPLTAWDELGDEAHWRNRPQDTPFFAVFNPTVTHESGMWPEKHEGQPLRTDVEAVELPPYLPNTPVCREALARHYDNLETADGRVGELLDQLEADGLANDTIVVLWSDHGEGLPRAKRWPYDAGIRIPLIVRWPGQVKAGSVEERLVSLIDLGPTMLSLTGTVRPRHLQGRPFLGPDAEPRQYIYASRDRHDEAHDRVRAVRDRRYKYLRHYYPERPYLLWNPYRNRHPVTQEMWRLYREGGLQGDQQLMFDTPRPAEELYDTKADPFEMVNLADDPEYGPVLERLRTALENWQDETGDLGEVAEEEMMRRFWPDGEQPHTSPARCVPIAAETHGLELLSEGTFSAPCRLQLHCATQGASMTYRTDSDREGRWRLYTEPIDLPPGTTTIRTRAVRIGYADSDELVARFTVA